MRRGLAPDPERDDRAPERVTMHRPVDFIIIGTQKGGTTALYEYMREQPAFSLPETKELHFFDDDAEDWAAPDYARYHRQFRSDGWDRIVGEATPIYCYWPQSLERIARYNPSIKLIYLLRDPVERAWSHWKMEFARGHESNPFSWCIREGRARLKAGSPDGHRRAFSYVERGFYGDQLQRVFSLFPREQVKVLRSTDLLSTPDEVMSQLSTFLDGPAPVPVRPREVHVSPRIEYSSTLQPSDVDYLRRLYFEDNEIIERLTGITFAQST